MFFFFGVFSFFFYKIREKEVGTRPAQGRGLALVRRGR
jgi:hypothetical protein